MPLSTNGKNKAADGVAAATGYLSLHTVDPDAIGTAEVTGGTPAYARKPVTWTPAVAGVAVIAAAVTFDIPPATTIGWVGMWSAATAGTFEGSAELSSAETYNGQGTYNLDALSVTVVT